MSPGAKKTLTQKLYDVLKCLEENEEDTSIIEEFIEIFEYNNIKSIDELECIVCAESPIENDEE